MFNGNHLPHEFLLTTTRNVFNNIMSTNLTLSKTQISKIIQFGRFLELLLSELVGSLMKVAVPLAKNILAPLGITTAASTIDAGIQKKIHGSGTTTLRISNEEMNDIMKIDQALEDSDVLLKGVTETIKNKTKKREGRLLGTLVGILGSILLQNLLSGKRIVRTDSGNKKGEGIVRPGYGKGIVRAGYGKNGIFDAASSFYKL